MYSSIQQKRCKGGCGRYPDMGGKGYCFNCKPEYKQEVIDRSNKRVAAKNSNSKLRSGIANEQENKSLAKNYGELDRWFKERRKEMTGRCHHCGGPSCKNDDKYYKFSICHILPKAYFPSVATHPSNFVELCFWNKNCHGNMDNKMLDLVEMACWDEIVTKFCSMYPFIVDKEKRRIPDVLLQYVEVEK